MAQYDSSRCVPMTSSHKASLRRHMVSLIENMEIGALCPHLVQSGVLTTSAVQKIQRGHAADTDKAFELIQLLQKRQDSCYYDFIDALKATGQVHLATLLEDGAQVLPPATSPINPTSVVPQVAAISIGKNEIVECPIEVYKQHKDESYDMAGKNKGRVLIVNITDIEHQGGVLKRDGAQRDVETLTALFSDLGFTVDIKNNPDYEDVQETLENFATSRRNEKAKSVFVILMSHGGTKYGSPYILTADGTRMEYMKELEKIFNAAKSPSLVSKPKVFLIQACMGNQGDLGVSYEKVQPQYDAEPESNIPEGVSSQRTATFSDYLYAFATRPDHKAERNPTYGSVFVQEINEVFREYSATRHVVDMLTKVRYNVEAKTQGQTYIQTPHDMNCLKQPFYLFPGI